MSELLEWTRVFIREHFRDPDPVLVLGECEDFAGTNNQAQEIGRISEALESGVPEDEVMNYRSSESDSGNGSVS